MLCKKSLKKSTGSSKSTNTMMTKRQTIIFKILNRKLKIEHHEPYYNPRMNSGAPGGLVVPAPLVVSVVLLLNDMNMNMEIVFKIYFRNNKIQYNYISTMCKCSLKSIYIV